MDILPTPHRIIPEQMTTAVVNGCPVGVRQVHRRWSAADYIPGAPESTWYEPVTITVAARIGLALEDAVAVLFDHCCPLLRGEGGGGVAVDELADDDFLLALLTDVVINGGCRELEELRCRLGEHTLSPEETTVLTYCRHRVTTVLATHATDAPSGDSVGVLW